MTLLLLLALGVRLGWSLSRPSDPATLTNLPDQVEYLSLARSLLDGQGLSMVDPRFNDRVFAFRMPGYPLFCAAAGGDLRIIRIVQAFLDASTVLATLWLARQWLSPWLSYLAAAFIAFDPIHVYFTSLILSETLFVCCLTWGVALLVHGRSPLARGKGAATWWAGVLILIASIYVRPSALLWPMLIAGAAVVHEHTTTSFKAGRRMPVLTLVALLTAIALLPWVIRNRATLGAWIITTTNDGFTLFDSWNRDATGPSDQTTIQNYPLVKGLPEVQRSRYLRAIAVAAAQDDPWRIVHKIPANLARLWTPWPLSNEFGSKRHYILAAACHALPLFALALVGLFRSGLGLGARFLLLTPILLVTIAHGLTIGSLRYRMPIHPELAILAAAALKRSERVRYDLESPDAE